MKRIIILVLIVITVVRSYGTEFLSNLTSTDIAVAKAEVSARSFQPKVEVEESSKEIAETSKKLQLNDSESPVDLMNPPFCIVKLGIGFGDTIGFLKAENPEGIKEFATKNVAIIAVNGTLGNSFYVGSHWKAQEGESGYVVYVGMNDPENVGCAIAWLEKASK